jgi:3-oxoacyl-[acyl-carrier-protein] synthase-3
MAYFKIENVKVSGISACVPKQVEENSNFPLFDRETFEKYAATTGVERKRVAPDNICTSDLCISAAENLIADLGWTKEDISILVFVTQTPDYILPATAMLIQHKLGLNKECYALDISLGCSGWIYGMSVVTSLLQSLNTITGKGKALLLTGDTHTRFCSKEDQSTYPLFGDVGAATALEYASDAEPMLFNMNSDGSGYKAIIINDGGFRNPFSISSLEKKMRGEGISSNNAQLVLDGMEVFSFGIKRAPECVNALIEKFDLDKNKIDYFIFHQANLMMNEQIRRKLKIPVEKVPYSLKNYGNTASASIPLTMATQIANELQARKLQHIACGFGVGLSWGSMYFSTDHIICPFIGEL